MVELIMRRNKSKVKQSADDTHVTRSASIHEWNRLVSGENTRLSTSVSCRCEGSAEKRGEKSSTASRWTAFRATIHTFFLSSFTYQCSRMGRKAVAAAEAALQASASTPGSEQPAGPAGCTACAPDDLLTAVRHAYVWPGCASC